MSMNNKLMRPRPTVPKEPLILTESGNKLVTESGNRIVK